MKYLFFFKFKILELTKNNMIKREVEAHTDLNNYVLFNYSFFWFWLNDFCYIGGTAVQKTQIPKIAKEEEIPNPKEASPSPIRITLASLDEYNMLLQNGLDFYGATFFPTEANLPDLTAAKIATKRGR